MANKVRISFVTNRDDPFMPLIDGEVDCEGVELVTTFSDRPRRSGGSSNSMSSSSRRCRSPPI